MDCKQTNKIYIGGLPRQTEAITLGQYFAENYGQVLHSEIITNREGISRGIGFVTFADSASAQKAIQDKKRIIIDERHVDVQEAIPKPLMKNRSHENNRPSNENMEFNPKKFFVGGLPNDLSEEEFKEFFEKEIGKVSEATLLYYENKKHRGFGFVIFESEESAKLALQFRYHDLNGKQIEVKQAKPEKPKFNNICNVSRVEVKQAKPEKPKANNICNVSRVEVTQAAPEMPMAYSYNNVQTYCVLNNGLGHSTYDCCQLYPGLNGGYYYSYNGYVQVYDGYDISRLRFQAEANKNRYTFNRVKVTSPPKQNPRIASDIINESEISSTLNVELKKDNHVEESEKSSTSNVESKKDNHVEDNGKKELDVDQTGGEDREVTFAF